MSSAGISGAFNYFDQMNKYVYGEDAEKCRILGKHVVTDTSLKLPVNSCSSSKTVLPVSETYRAFMMKTMKFSVRTPEEMKELELEVFEKKPVGFYFATEPHEMCSCEKTREIKKLLNVICTESIRQLFFDNIESTRAYVLSDIKSYIFERDLVDNGIKKLITKNNPLNRHDIDLLKKEIHELIISYISEILNIDKSDQSFMRSLLHYIADHFADLIPCALGIEESETDQSHPYNNYKDTAKEIKGWLRCFFTLKCFNLIKDEEQFEFKGFYLLVARRMDKLVLFAHQVLSSLNCNIKSNKIKVLATLKSEKDIEEFREELKATLLKTKVKPENKKMQLLFIHLIKDITGCILNKLLLEKYY